MEKERLRIVYSPLSEGIHIASMNKKDKTFANWWIDRTIDFQNVVLQSLFYNKIDFGSEKEGDKVITEWKGANDTFEITIKKIK